MNLADGPAAPSAILPFVPAHQDVADQAVLRRLRDLLEALPSAIGFFRPTRAIRQAELRVPTETGRRRVPRIHGYTRRPLVLRTRDDHAAPVLQPGAQQAPRSET